jgi:diguanylate cyclase (GGDEF)-like protein
MEIPFAKIAIETEHDTVAARRLAQQAAELAGFGAQDRTRIATAVSEIARNALKYAGRGVAVCSVLFEINEQFLMFTLNDDGPGIAELQEILDGAYCSRTGMGVGIAGSRKLMERFAVDTSPNGGTMVTMGKRIPARRGRRLTPEEVGTWTGVLVSEPTPAAAQEARRSSLDMLRSLNVLKHNEAQLTRQLSEVERLNQELVCAKHKLEELATVDPLTGLHNRRALLERVQSELARARRTGQPLSVAMVDLDHFKRLNDTRGHAAGDNALREAARRMQGALRPYDTVGRYGGEEFLVVLPGCDAGAAAALAERVRRAVGDEPIQVDDGTARVTCSIGVSTTNGAPTLEQLVAAADDALYRAKDCGRDRVEIANDDGAGRANSANSHR